MIQKKLSFAVAGSTIAIYAACGMAFTIGYIVGCFMACGLLMLAVKPDGFPEALDEGIGEEPERSSKRSSLIEEGEHQEAALENFVTCWESTQSVRPDKVSLTRVAFEVYWFDKRGKLLAHLPDSGIEAMAWVHWDNVCSYIGSLDILTSTVFTPSCGSCAMDATGVGEFDHDRGCLRRCRHCNQFYYAQPPYRKGLFLRGVPDSSIRQKRLAETF